MVMESDEVDWVNEYIVVRCAIFIGRASGVIPTHNTMIS